MDSYRNMAVSQSKSDLKRQMKRFAGMKLRNLNDPYANEPAPLTFIRDSLDTRTRNPVIEHVCRCT